MLNPTISIEIKRLLAINCSLHDVHGATFIEASDVLLGIALQLLQERPLAWHVQMLRKRIFLRKLLKQNVPYLLIQGQLLDSVDRQCQILWRLCCLASYTDNESHTRITYQADVISSTSQHVTEELQVRNGMLYWVLYGERSFDTLIYKVRVADAIWCYHSKLITKVYKSTRWECLHYHCKQEHELL